MANPPSAPTDPLITKGLPGALTSLNPFVKIGPDDTITVVIKHAEFGQGITTGLTTIVAEEMDADWEQMRWEFAPADVQLYANSRIGVQGTVSSSSIANSWEQLREAGASARAVLVQAAADAWQVEAAELTVEGGRNQTQERLEWRLQPVRHRGRGARAAQASRVQASGRVRPHRQRCPTPGPGRKNPTAAPSSLWTCRSRPCWSPW